jgi:hypothetical protein
MSSEKEINSKRKGIKMLFWIFYISTGYVEDFKKYARGPLQFPESREHSSRKGIILLYSI